MVFTNGSQDPWRHASKQVSSPSLPSYLITCDNYGHGTDLRGCPQSPLVPEGWQWVWGEHTETRIHPC
ncbi:putative alpha/Beta hydrolase [Helianthus annuus]|uniref:Alpha/Beta hydrolase n=1 Tax=Helianthus annuus TaxID=4232 RepID=A0A251VPI8_HELAN|nr:putative alpha/Beta hydrolase [Helianthus annuus]KAJ0623240.1 putative alpha/Beta hydrolase [Helianthus annuus]